MLEVIKQIINQRKAKQDVVLVGIMEASGSIPRKKRAYMVVGKDGLLAGTVGGGNLEFQAIQVAKQFFAEEFRPNLGVISPKDKPEIEVLGFWPESGYQIQTYELTIEDSAKLGMVCGGRAKLLFYPISWKEPRLEKWLEAWEMATLAGQDYDLRFYNIFQNALPLTDCDILHD